MKRNERKNKSRKARRCEGIQWKSREVPCSKLYGYRNGVVEKAMDAEHGWGKKRNKGGSRLVMLKEVSRRRWNDS